ncbi:hypothetical protein ACLB2K_048084 [Fragaria x ananassa]
MEITGAIRRELFKSRNEIDAKLIREVVEHLEDQGSKEKKKKEEDQGSDEEDGSGEQDSEGRGEDSEDSEEVKEEEVDVLKVDTRKREKCIKYLQLMSREMGLSVKEGHEERILNLMIPYIRDSYAYYTGIMAFLTSLGTVETALKSSKACL